MQWKYVMIYLLGNTLAYFALSLWLNVWDARHGGNLNQSRREKQQAALLSTYDDIGADEEDRLIN